MKAVTAALTKRAISNAKAVHSEERVWILLLKQSFSCKYPGNSWCSRKSVSQDWINYSKNKDATFAHLQ